MICSKCSKDIVGNECSMCLEQFVSGAPVLCDYSEHHFCSEECLLQFYSRDYEIGNAIPKENANGDCYEIHAKLIEDLQRGLLCHGTVTGQGPIDGIEYGHAWVEIADIVIDISNGKSVCTTKERYYKLGKVKDVICYTPEETVKKLVDTRSYGPWK